MASSRFGSVLQTYLYFYYYFTYFKKWKTLSKKRLIYLMFGNLNVTEYISINYSNFKFATNDNCNLPRNTNFHFNLQ